MTDVSATRVSISSSENVPQFTPGGITHAQKADIVLKPSIRPLEGEKRELQRDRRFYYLATPAENYDRIDLVGRQVKATHRRPD